MCVAASFPCRHLNGSLNKQTKITKSVYGGCQLEMRRLEKRLEMVRQQGPVGNSLGHSDGHEGLMFSYLI